MSNRPARRISALLAVVSLVSSSSVLSVGSAQPAAPSHSGSWRGEITATTQYGIPPESEAAALSKRREYRINISKKWVPSVSYRRRTAWEGMPLRWTLSRVGEQGVVIYGHHSGQGWVEAQVFTIAPIDDNTLLVQWWRVVNNVALDPTADTSRWALGGYGEFTRVGRR